MGPQSGNFVNRAKKLEEAINTFDPERALLTEEELDAFFVDRGKGPLEEMKILLTESSTPQKILFTGHRGSGKSTELARLAHSLKESFFIVFLSAEEILDLRDINYPDIILTMAMELFGRAAEERLRLNRKLMEDIHAWFRETFKEVEVTVSKGQGVSAGLKAYFAGLEGKLEREAVTRRLVREKVEPRLSQLLERLNLLIGDVERKAGKKVLIIVDDLDHADLKVAKELFYEHGAALSQPECHLIYTFPIALRHDNDFIQMREGFTDLLPVLPNFRLRDEEGNPDKGGRRLLRELVLKRAEEALFEEAALEQLVNQSGGLTRQLVRLVRLAALEALMAERDRITADDVEEAVSRLRQDYEVLLDSKQREALRRVRETKRVENDELHRSLLHNLSVLEYRNRHLWYDVNPIVTPLLEERP